MRVGPSSRMIFSIVQEASRVGPLNALLAALLITASSTLGVIIEPFLAVKAGQRSLLGGAVTPDVRVIGLLDHHLLTVSSA